MKISTHSNLHRLESRQVLKMDLDTAWEYFSNPANLEKITPPEMRFKITSPMLESRTYPGQIISYKVSPFPGFRSNWVTEIRALEEKQYFIDEQRFGPYAFWHHTHWFKPHPDGVEMIDQVYYKLPFGFLGRWVNALFVKSRLMHIFNYRKEALVESLNGK